MITTLISAGLVLVMALAMFIVGRASVKTPPPSADIKRLDFILRNHCTVLYNKERDAWCVLDEGNQFIAADKSLRVTVDQAIGVSK